MLNINTIYYFMYWVLIDKTYRNLIVGKFEMGLGVDIRIKKVGWHIILVHVQYILLNRRHIFFTYTDKKLNL